MKEKKNTLYNRQKSASTLKHFEPQMLEALENP
jgi:hypothetical protein